jgi:hypothetical protein
MPPQLAHYRHLTHGRVFGPVEGRFRELREHHRQTGHNPKTSNGRVGDNTPGTGTIFFNGLGARRPRSYQQRLGPFEEMPTHSVHATAIQAVGLRQPASQSLGAVVPQYHWCAWDVCVNAGDGA